MKMTRKGFTLIELLIIIAIIGVLSATMMVGVSGSTAKAKAVTIANNVESMKLAASNYYANNMDNANNMAVSTAAMLACMEGLRLREYQIRGCRGY